MKLLLVLAASLAVAAGGRVDLRVEQAVANGGVTEAMIQLPQIMDQVEASSTLQALSGDEKVTAMVSMLQGLTGAAQAPFIAQAKALSLEMEQFWASNIILVKGLTSATLAKLAATPGEFTIRPQHTASIYPSIVHGKEFEVEPNSTQTYQWGVSQIRAPAAWSSSDGTGQVAAIIDTGVNVGHTALSAGYAGAWADPYYNTAGPTDQHGHGSHCAGTILGRANGVGVAPGARWIGCRGLNHQGSGTEAGLTTCAQFMLTANPRPNVVSNSWGGGSGQTWYNTQVTAWRNADIVPVFAIGNAGAACRTANSPGDQAGLISVGATTNTDAMASFSSRGPNAAGALKPEVSAPGANIVSCGTGAANYATMSGTSMATPHVAGLVCLIRGANPSYTFADVERALHTTGEQPSLSNADRGCGLPGGGDFPNHAFGHGRVDAVRAVAA